MMNLVLWACLAVLALVFLNVCVNLFTFPRLVPTRLPDAEGVEWPMISILVPARNEEAVIRRCVESLLAQNYPRFELIVLDDGSGDGTRAVLERIKAEHTRSGLLRILTGKPLPEGWIGKCWACRQLAEEATGDWLLFTDADTWHHPGALSAALSLAEDRRADLLSGWPRQLMETFSERLAVPMVQIILIGYCPLWLLNAVRSPRMVAACGQFMLWRAEAYRAVGGHEAVKAHLVEDVALAGHALKRGLRLVNADATDTVSTRMYGGFRELWRGFTKNFYRGFGGHPLPFFVFLILQTAPFLLPWIALGSAAAHYQPPPADEMGVRFLVAPFFIQNILAALLALGGFIVHGLPAIRFKQSGISVLFYPLAELLVIAIGLNSFLNTTSRKGVEWKGRQIAKSI